MREAPRKLANLLTLLSENRLRVTLDGLDDSKMMENMQKIANRITVGLIIAALLVSSALMMRTNTGATLFGFIPWTTMEAAPMVTRAPGWARTMAKVLWRYYSDIPQRLRSKRSRFLVFGNSIAGKLKLALNRYGGEMWLSSPLKALIREGDVVTGAVIQHEGRAVRVRARAGARR